MSLGQALFQVLRDDAPVAAIVVDRIYPGVAPLDAPLPFITYQRISSTHERHMTARSGSRIRACRSICWSTSGITLESLVDKVRLKLDRFSGPMGTIALQVFGAYLENIRDDQVIPKDGSEQVHHRASMEFIIWHAET